MKRIGTLLLAASIVAGALFAPTAALAHGPRLWLLIYYSDMEMTNPVGWAVEYCDEHTDFGGYPTIWPQYETVEGCG